MEDDVTNAISYETIFDILRRERSTDSLQKLEDSFYSNVLKYIGEKSVVGEQELLFNVKKMLKEIYERREKKIVSIAVDKCRLGMESMNIANILREERAVYDQVAEVLQTGRKNILDMLLKKQILQAGSSHESGTNGLMSTFKSADTMIESKESLLSQEPLPETTLVRFLHAVPKFVGRELEVYGPFEHEDIANLPREIANLLISKGRAEEIRGG